MTLKKAENNEYKCITEFRINNSARKPCIFLVAFRYLNSPNETRSVQLLVKTGRETGLNVSLCH